jgi:segregation and condensation protein A
VSDEMPGPDELATRTGAASAGDAPPDGAADQYRIHLEAFEGPLDLLLYLIRKEEVSIYDIPIARVTEQYLEYLRLMEELDIGVAGEFLLMAATLIHIKSKMLLPRDPLATGDADELEDPRQELVERLLEHQRYKTAGEALYQRGQLEQAVFTRVDEENKLNSEVAASVFDLLTAFRDVLLRAQAVMEIEIARDEVTLAQKLAEVRALVAIRSSFSVRELFERSRSRRELIITFLAVLELVKERVLRIVQSDTFGEIEAQRRELEYEDGAGAPAEW